MSAKQQPGSCSIAMQQMVAIARAVDMDCKVLILDEPTSSLDESEVEKLFGMMRQLKERGVGIIFVTHFLDQVYEICDRITVMRDGQLVGEYEIEKMPRVDLVAAMLGKQMDDMADIKGDYATYAGEDAERLVYEPRASRATRPSTPSTSTSRRARSRASPVFSAPVAPSACAPSLAPTALRAARSRRPART